MALIDVEGPRQLTLSAPVADLARRLTALADSQTDRWAFPAQSSQDVARQLYQYPAMMVPRLQREILEVCTSWAPTIRTVYDPFVGSGTVIAESMLLGLDVVGGDINPLAILISTVRAETLPESETLAATRLALADVASARKAEVHQFPGRSKWFNEGVAAALDQIRGAIRRRRSAPARRFLWVALAETVRLVSNSRTSTVKLHIRAATEIASRPDPVRLFAEIARRNAQRLDRFRAALVGLGRLGADGYRGVVDLRVIDAQAERVVASELVMTSPPYGDGHSTVAYGQASYLALQWIDRRDILASGLDACVRSTHQLDSMSLGGSLAGWPERAQALQARSNSLASAFRQLRHLPPDRTARIASFYWDLDISLSRTLDRVVPGGVLVWTVGDRSVGNVRVPMAQVLCELAGFRAIEVVQLRRTIPLNRKRMAGRNPISATMSRETVLLLSRSSSDAAAQGSGNASKRSM